jgi:hypothetical protein
MGGRFSLVLELERPVGRHLLGTGDGVIRGKNNLRPFVENVFRTTPASRKRHRRGFFTDGRLLMWEYPRVTDHGEQIDLVEVMELENGLIRHHRVYWGWFGVNALQSGEHRRD